MSSFRFHILFYFYYFKVIKFFKSYFYFYFSHITAALLTTVLHLQFIDCRADVLLACHCHARPTLAHTHTYRTYDLYTQWGATTVIAHDINV